MSDIYPIAVPKWGIEMVEGTINTWNKQEGDSVAKGEEVFEMESDKIVNVWEAPVDGILRRVIAMEGDAHPVGALLGVIATADVGDEAIDTFIANYAGVDAAEPNDSQSSATQATDTPVATSRAGAEDANTRSTPAVRALAQELGVDLNTVSGTGRRGRITEDDVRTATGIAPPVPGVEVIPLSATRKTIARRLTEAKQEIPHYYLSVDYDIDGLLAHRARLNATGDIRVSVNDLMVWCVARALQKEPRVNINLINDEIHQFDDAHISIAMATDEGLYPVTLRNAQTLSPEETSTAVAALAAKASSGELSKDDISGGTFTVSNLGMYGVSEFTAIINPPMGAILALGRGEQKVVVREGAPAVATMVTATLSCDHRVIDGALGAQFLQALGEELAELH